MKNKRVPEIEIMKAISIIAMIFVHVYERSYNMSFPHGLEVGVPFVIAYIIEFIGSSATGVFMFTMGWGAYFSKKATPAFLVKRASHLALLGLLVNVFTQYIIRLIDPVGYGELKDNIPAILAVDIYFYAALVMLFFALIKKLSSNIRLAFLVSLGVVVITQLVVQILGAESFSTGNVWCDTLIGLFIRLNDYSYFPYFSWGLFAIVGYWIGYYYEKTDVKKYNLILLIFGIIAVIVPTIILKETGARNIAMNPMSLVEGKDFYSPDIWNTLCYLGLVAVYIVISSGVMYLLKQELPQWISFLSRSVMTVYISQWILNVLLNPIILKINSIWGVIIMASIVLALTVVISLLRNKLVMALKDSTGGTKSNG